MKKILACIILALALQVTAGCGQKDRREFVLRQIQHEPAKLFEYYTFNPESSLISRVKKAPEFLISYLNRMDNATGYTPYSPTEKEMQLIDEYINQLPEQVKKALRKKLLGIYFIDNYVSGGLSDWVLGNGGERYCFVVFNAQILKTTATEWLTFKDGTCFTKDDPFLRVEINCGPDLPEFAEILFHESAHLADYIIGFTPYVEEHLLWLDGERADRKRFTEGIWKNYFKPVRHYDFKLRDKLFFYGLTPASVSIKNAEKIYENLSKTPFVSIYASKNWADDFACLFTAYYITQVLKKPYEIRVLNNGAQVFRWSPADSELVSRRFPLIKEIFDAR